MLLTGIGVNVDARQSVEDFSRMIRGDGFDFAGGRDTETA